MVPGEILLSPNKVSFRENLLPEGTLSPNGCSFREEPSPGRHFIPEWLRFSGGNALLVPREILLSPKEVSFWEEPSPGGTLSPIGYGFREEMPSQR